MTGKPTYEELEQRVRELERVESESKQAEEALRETNRLLEGVLDGVPDIIGIQNPDHTIVRYNKAGYEALNLTHEEVVGKLCFSFLGRTAICENCATARALKSKKLEAAEQFVPELGRHLLCRSNPILDDTGEVRLIIEQLQDITERKQAEEALRESEERFYAMFKHMGTGVAVYEAADDGRDFVFKEFNPAAEVITRINRDEALGRRLLGSLRRVWRTGRSEDLPPFFYRDAIREGWRDNRIYKLPSGEVVALFDDVTERVQSQLALEQSQECFLAMLNGIDVTIYVTDMETSEILFMNKHKRKAFGGDFTGQSCWKVFRQEIGPCAHCPRERLLDERGNPAGAYIWEDLNPVTGKWYINSDRAIKWVDDRLVHLQVATDITELKRTEEALRESEQFRGRIIQSLSSGLYIYNVRGSCNDFITPQYTVITGWTLDKINNMEVDFNRLFHPEDLPRVEEHFRKLMGAKDGDVLEIEYRFRTKDGRWIWCISRDTIFERDENGDVLRFLGSFFDITKRKDAESERERLLSAMEQAAEVMVITDPDGAIQYVNPAFERVTGYTAEEVKGKNPRILKSGKQDEGFYRELWQTITSGRNWQGRFLNRRKDGSLYTEEASISPVMDATGRINNFVAVKRDISSEIELETRLAQAQKMEAIGTLAGGIAHDFNNILSAVMGYSEMAKSDLPEESYASQCIEEVLLASHRAKDLVKQILAFRRLSEEGMQPLKAGLLLKEAVKLLRASLPSTIEIRTEISASKDTILADATQIHQVVMNLCTNAYHAMHESGGTLRVTLKQLDVDAHGKPGYEDLDPGRYIVLGIADTGHGMSPEVMERIFDPYFTTKEKGVGTGLGLSVVHGIVKRHGGTIRVRSLLSEGTTFQILLPLIEEGTAVPSPAPVDAPKGTGRILFVDDEAPIANIGRQMLCRLGYDVEVATGSMEALELFESRPDDFDLVITDMTMPHLRGDELARAVMDVRPDMPVILCTGYSDMINEEKARAMNIRRALEKPVGMLEMAGAVHDVLSGEDHSSGDG